MTHNEKVNAALDVAIGFGKAGMWSNARYTRGLLECMVDDGLLQHEETRGLYSRYTITEKGRAYWRTILAQQPLVLER